jgi:hypothetical protein
MRRAALILLLGLTACTSKLKTPAAPDDLIPRDSMVGILRELVVIEGYMETRYRGIRNYGSAMVKSGDAVLKKNHVTRRRFERSYAYYVSQQDELQGIYTEVLDSLNVEVNRLRSQKGQQPANFAEDTVPGVVSPFGDNR